MDREARMEGTGQSGEWKMTGWRASGDFLKSVAERIHATGQPPSAT